MMNTRTSVAVSDESYGKTVNQAYQRAESDGNSHQLIVGTGATVFDHCSSRS
jgi:4-diphosphocytidyl-2C-methyl-D-erythritol kinase